MLVPKLVSTLRDYDRDELSADLAAGVIVGIVALPLAIAFAIASGVAPERGLYPAIAPGFLISAPGGPPVPVGGPTGGFVVIVSGIVAQHGVDGLVVATIMAGLLLVAFGLFRMGGAIKFIPHPVTIGFTSGIALIIFSGQVKDMLGLDAVEAPAGFLAKWDVLAANFESLNPWALAVGAATMFVIALCPRTNSRIPGTFVALVMTTVLVRIFHLPVETIHSRFGAIHAGLPHPSLPHVTLPLLSDLMGPAFTIPMLAGIESL